MYYFFTVLAAFGFCLQFVFMKIYEKKAGKTLLFSAFFSLASGFVAALFFLCVNGFRLQVTLFSLCIALAWAAALIACGMLGIRAVSLGNMAVYTMFMMLGGMFLPFLFGIIFLGESVTPLKIVALVLLVAACIIPCLKKSGEKSAKLFYVVCLAVFLLNGGISILGKVHQISAAPIPTVDFLIWANLFTFALSTALTGALYLLSRRKKNAGLPYIDNSDAMKTNVSCKTSVTATPPAKLAGKTALLCGAAIVGYALTNSTANLLNLIGAAHLPASVLYPIVTGGTVVLTTLAGALLFKEKISLRILIATLLSFAATVLFMF